MIVKTKPGRLIKNKSQKERSFEHKNENENENEEDAVRMKMLLERYENARKHRDIWNSLWDECYDYALPRRGGFYGELSPAGKRNAHIYDATAMDAADRLAASLLGNLTPSWSRWFSLKPGPDASPDQAKVLAPALEKAAAIIHSHFERSNFAVEIHQCYLDLVVGGTAGMFFEESDPGNFSAFSFHASPLTHIVLEEGASGFLDGTFRRISMTFDQLASRYQDAEIPRKLGSEAAKDPMMRFEVLEAILPGEVGFNYTAMLIHDYDRPVMLDKGSFAQNPAINFRWSKSPGEIYGRSPVMKALPDIKTANKVVELILKNASIAITGIWQADDDGILNPANIELVPGTIIPKAIGSKGLQPLEMPGQFDVSQLMLENLQANIRSSLLADKTLLVAGANMSATEVLARSSEIAIILGATYGRLQSELLTPLIKRAYAILQRRAEVPDINLDGHMIAIDYRSPLARAQGRRDVQNTLSWIDALGKMGAPVNISAAAKFLAEALSVPGELVSQDATSDIAANMPDMPDMTELMASLAEQTAQQVTDALVEKLGKTRITQ